MCTLKALINLGFRNLINKVSDSHILTIGLDELVYNKLAILNYKNDYEFTAPELTT